jgi:membrane protein YdbS with pleckstrin-like domain
VVWPCSCERKPAGNRGVPPNGAGVLADANEEICLEARRHGIVLARPLVWAIVLAGAGGVLVTLPRPVSLAGAGVVALGALVALRAVWKWERTRVVVTTEKVFVVTGTLRRRARAVRLAAVEAVELEQTFPGQLLGYGTVVVGPLALDYVPKPKSVYRLLERLTP